MALGTMGLAYCSMSTEKKYDLVLEQEESLKWKFSVFFVLGQINIILKQTVNYGNTSNLCDLGIVFP